MRRIVLVWAVVSLGFSSLGWAYDFADPIPENGRLNPYGLSAEDLEAARRRGLLHALQYPETDISITLPLGPIDRAMSTVNVVPLAGPILRRTGLARFGLSWEEIYDTLGLSRYPDEEGEGPFFVPFPDGRQPGDRMGFSRVTDRWNVPSMSYSCAACHVRSLFGRPVIGATSLRSRANEFYLHGKQLRRMSNLAFKLGTGANRAEMASLTRARAMVPYLDQESA